RTVTPPPASPPLSLHDALPIYRPGLVRRRVGPGRGPGRRSGRRAGADVPAVALLPHLLLERGDDAGEDRPGDRPAVRGGAGARTPATGVRPHRGRVRPDGRRGAPADRRDRAPGRPAGPAPDAGGP